MSDNLENRDSHLESVEKLKREVGEQLLGPHRGGYLSQSEYATKIYYWAGEEHAPEEIDGVIYTLANAAWAKTHIALLPVAAVVDAFGELYPDKAAGWRSAFPELFERVARAKQLPHDFGGWNAYHIAQWFVLRRARPEEGIELLDKVLDRAAAGGHMRVNALQALNHWAEQCKPFQIAWQRAAAKRAEQMIVKVQ